MKAGNVKCFFLMIFYSRERCQVTSAAFTKGFLDLEGQLTPILVQMVMRNAKAHALLDNSSVQSKERDLCKKWLDTLFNSVRFPWYSFFLFFFQIDH
jgi:hypothetical protein